MSSNVETLGSLERRVSMSVPTAEIEKQVDERLKKMARNVRMPGFRPGKVPMKLIAQTYGPQVRSEVLGDAVQKAFSDAVRDANLRVAGYPRIERKDVANDAALEFSATFEVYPEIKIGDVSSATIERPQVTVDDAAVDKTIEILRKQRVHYHVADRGAENGDRITIDYTGTQDGTEFEGGSGKDHTTVLGEGRLLADFEKAVVGLRAGESRTFELTFPEDYHGKDVAGKTASFSVTVKQVETPHLPEVDAEFAKQLGIGDGDIR